MRNRAIIRATPLVSVGEAALIAIACADQLRNELRPRWGKAPETAPAVTFFANDDAPADYGRIVLCERGASATDLLGYHERGYAPIFVDLILKNGGEVLDGRYSVSHIVSHEVCEDDGNENTDQWRTGPDGAEWAQELCDAVEGDFYAHDVTGCALSNFLLPAYFDASRRGGRYDYLGVLSAPFTIAHNGYAIRKVKGERVDTFGAAAPEWRREYPRGRVKEVPCPVVQAV